jgi:hypothetical protein
MPVYTFTTFNDPSASTGTTQAYGINDSDQIVGIFSDGMGNHGFIASNGIFTTLDDPAASFGTTPVGINDSGTIVGYFLDAGFTREGFIKSGGTYTTLDDPLATNGSAFTGIKCIGTGCRLLRKRQRLARLHLQSERRRHFYNSGRSRGHLRHLSAGHQCLGHRRRILR